jgi:DNA-binding MarR family transcriptional regulator
MIEVDSKVLPSRILRTMTTIHEPSTSDRALLSNQIMAQIRGALRELRCMGGDRMRRADVPYTHFHIVSMLERHGEMPMSRLAEMLDVSLSNASGVIERLEDRGLVERVRESDDRRVVLVRTTNKGRSVLSELEVLKDEMLRSVLGRLDASQLERVAGALDDLTGAVAAVVAADPELARHDHVHDHPHEHPVDTATAASHA